MGNNYQMQQKLQEAIDNAKLPYFVGIVADEDTRETYFTVENIETHNIRSLDSSVETIGEFAEAVKGSDKTLDAILHGLAELEAHAETQYMTDEDLLINQAEVFAKEHLLPSGSGFDFDWDITIEEDPDTGRGILHCESYYENIDGETGMYMDSIPVVADIPMDDPESFVLGLGKPYNGNPDDYSPEMRGVIEQYEESFGSVDEFLVAMEDDFVNYMECFNDDKAHASALADIAKQLGFKTPHRDAENLQFDLSKFTKEDLAPAMELMSSIHSKQEAEHVSKTAHFPEIVVNGLSYKGELVFNNNLQEAGLRFGFDNGKERWLGNAELPTWYKLSIEHMPLEAFQQKVMDDIRRDIETAIEIGNLTSDILKCQTAKDADKCIAAARKHRAEQKKSAKKKTSFAR